MKKKLFIGCGIVTILLVGAGYYVLQNAGRMIEYGIEKYGSPILGVPVKVRSVLVVPLVGKGSVRGLTIGNPPGYQEKNMVELDSVSLSLNLRSLLTNTIRVNEISLNSPYIYWEGTISNDSNVAEVQANVAKAMGTSSSKSEKKFWIGKFIVKGAKVKALVKGVGPMDLELQDIVLTNISSENKDKAIKQISGIVLGEISKKVLIEVMKRPEVQELTNKAVQGIIGGIKSIFGK